MERQPRGQYIVFVRTYHANIMEEVTAAELMELDEAEIRPHREPVETPNKRGAAARIDDSSKKRKKTQKIEEQKTMMEESAKTMMEESAKNIMEEYAKNMMAYKVAMREYAVRRRVYDEAERAWMASADKCIRARAVLLGEV